MEDGASSRGSGMELSATEAAREVGKSVQTITRAIQSGRMSASGPKGGPYRIDPSELFRVYPRRTLEPSATPSMAANASGEKLNATGVLELEVKLLREMLVREQDTVADLRARLDAEAEERRRLTALVTFQPERPAPAVEPAGDPSATLQTPRHRSSWWQRLMGA